MGDWLDGQLVDEDDSEQLQFDDAKNGFNDFFWALNPLNWISAFWYFVFGFPVWDLFDLLSKK